MKTTKALDDFNKNASNKYLDFIALCKQKAEEYSPEQRGTCTYHHIVPRHHYKANELSWDNFESPENLVLVTFEDHIKAHELRFEVYGENGDNIAALRMAGHKEEGMRAMQQAGGQAVNKIFKEKKQRMHNQEFQKEMARRSMARPDARQIRSEGGKKVARVRHQNRTVRATDRFLWRFKGEDFLCTFGFDNAGDLCRELNLAKPEIFVGCLSGLLTGKRKTNRGWSCEKIEESSENEEQT